MGHFFWSSGFTPTLFICPLGVAGAVKDCVGVLEDVGARVVVEDAEARGAVARAGRLALFCFLHKQDA